MLAPDLAFQQDSAGEHVSLSSREQFLTYWESQQETMFRGASEYIIKEAAVDEVQKKVWIVAEARVENETQTGGAAVVVEMVEMLSFDQDGRVCEIVEGRRRIRVGKETGEEH
jgi:hypothetical protein